MPGAKSSSATLHRSLFECFSFVSAPGSLMQADRRSWKREHRTVDAICYEWQDVSTTEQGTRSKQVEEPMLGNLSVQQLRH